jgi:hypothetical protein
MAEPSADHPAFTWLMLLLRSRSEPDSGDPEATSDIPGRWVISDGKRAVAAGGNLSALLESIPADQMGSLAVAYWRFSRDKPQNGNWDFGPSPPSPSDADASELFSALVNLNASLTK